MKNFPACKEVTVIFTPHEIFSVAFNNFSRTLAQKGGLGAIYEKPLQKIVFNLHEMSARTDVPSKRNNP